jgi:hypothetical protein
MKSIISTCIIGRDDTFRSSDVIQINGTDHKVTAIKSVKFTPGGQVEIVFRALPISDDVPAITDHDRDRAREYGVSKQLLYWRLNKSKRKWTKEEAITTPPGSLQKTKDGDLQEALSNGIGEMTFYSRLRNGWSVKQAKTIPVNSHLLLTDEENAIRIKNKITRRRVGDRLQKGWTIQEAITIPMSVPTNKRVR